jgi:hypothetical protein
MGLITLWTFCALLSGDLLAEERVDYLQSVKPILAGRCYACHGALKQKNELRVDTAASLKKGGIGGPAIVSGDSSHSPLVERLTSSRRSHRMPPPSQGETLSAREVALIRTWIDQGAVAPADEKPEVDPRGHWAFRRAIRPDVPHVANSTWVRNPIDAFIAAGHQAHGLTPQPTADKRILLRRVYLDLIGLPPTRAELAAFLADESPRAYEQVVDRLLTSPQYGERWGRHWMDIWRYSDWWGLGAEVRNSQKHIWHWRDWIVESLNTDKGYDQMLREMLAADELYADDPDRLRATGYLARSYFRFNRNTWLDEVVEHTSKAFLGLTLNCAKCHDHKYDPFTQEEYYRLRAFFEPYQIRTDMLPGEADFEKDGIPRVFDCNLDTPTFLFVRGDEKLPATENPLQPAVPAILSLSELRIESVPLAVQSHSPGLRAFVLENYLKEADHRVSAAHSILEQARKRAAESEQARLAVVVAEKALAAAQLHPFVLKARAAADRACAQQPTAADAPQLRRQAAVADRLLAVAAAEVNLAQAELQRAKAADGKREAEEKKIAAAREKLDTARKMLDERDDHYTPLCGSLKAPESPVETEGSRQKPFPAVSTGRRSALARWLTDPRHPLTARVAVNHIWGRHFGTPLVPTVFDFGRKGARPTHPELLDWLAVELMENGWSMKHLHRLIVTSNTYRMTSSAAGATAANRETDLENRYYWRTNSLRMEAEVIRDSLLHLAGTLENRLGGASIPVNEETSRRRSLYFVHSHNEQHKLLSIFDNASVLECYRRAESIVPQQALALENSRLAWTSAERIAQRLTDELGEQSDAAFLRAAFEAVLDASPTEQELAECAAALKQLKDLGGVQRARATVVHALLNHNDFITIR